MRRIDILLLPDRIVVNPSSRVLAGYWIAHGPWTQLATDSDPTVVAEAVKSALSESRVGIPQPEDLKALTKERLSAAGVRSERAYHTGSSMLSVRWEDQRYFITPYSNGGTSGDQKGFTPLVSRRVEVPDDSLSDELGIALLGAFQHCEPQPNNSFKPTPLRGSAQFRR